MRSLSRAWSAVVFGVTAGALAGWAERHAARSRAARVLTEDDGGRASIAETHPATRVDEEDVPDSVLVERVREQAAVPDGVEVVMTEGAVVLFGRILRSAVQPLLERVSNVEGVTVIENRLTAVDEPFERPTT